MPTLLILCQKRQLQAIVDELADWQEEGVQILLHGVSNKAHDGFVLLRWDRPIPQQFITKLERDSDILDYLPYDIPAQGSSVVAHV